MHALLNPLWAVAVDSAVAAQTLRHLLAFAPIGLVLAVLMLEIFSAGRRSKDVDGGVLVILGSAGIILAAGAIAAFSVAEKNSASKETAVGLILAIVCGATAVVRQQWICQISVDQLRQQSRKKTPGGARRAWASIYGLMLLLTLTGLIGFPFLGATKPATENAPIVASLPPAIVDEPEESADEANAIAGEPAHTDQAPPVKLAEETTEVVAPEPSPVVAPEPVAKAEPAVALTGSKPAKETVVEPELTKPEPPPVASPAANAAFASYIVPIFRENCYSCHGPEKQKGGLRLDSPEAIRAGGKSGPCLEPGNPSKSPLYISVTLPDGDADLMPAQGKRLNPQQTDLLQKWIKAGAPMGDGKVMASKAAAPSAAKGALALDPTLAKAIGDHYIVLRPIGGKTGRLEADCSQVRNYEVKLDIAVLTEVADRLEVLDLSRSAVKDEDLAHVAKMINLNTLKLNGTKVGDPALAHLAKLTHLETLNLYGTQVSDAGLVQLAGLPSLKKLYLWNTQATEEGISKLKQSRPNLVVSTGS